MASAPGLDTEAVKLSGMSQDPRVAMQTILDALSGYIEAQAELASVKAERDAAVAELERVRNKCEIAETLLAALGAS